MVVEFHRHGQQREVAVVAEQPDRLRGQLQGQRAQKVNQLVDYLLIVEVVLVRYYPLDEWMAQYVVCTLVTGLRELTLAGLRLQILK